MPTMNKKISLILVSMLLFLGVVLYTTNVLILYFEEKNITRFIEKSEEAIGEGQNQHHYSTQSGSTYISVYLPKDNAGNVWTDVEKKVQAYLNREVGNKKKEQRIRDVVFVRSRTKDSGFKGVTIHQIEVETYHIDGFSIESHHKQTLTSKWLTESSQEFSLSSFLTDIPLAQMVFAAQLKVNLVKKGQEQDEITRLVNQFLASSLSSFLTDIPLAQTVFAAQLKADLVKKGQKQDEITRLVNQFLASDLLTYKFEYADSQLTLKISEKNYGIKTISVPLASLYSILQSEYLTDKDKESYDAYQVEQERIAKQKRIALTFDDGPNRSTTPKVLDMLKKRGLKATFFVLGQNIAGNEDILKRIVEEGHEVGNHTWSHPNLTTLSPEQVQREIVDTQKTIKETIGYEPTLMRPPYGAINQATMTVVNMPIIYWSVDSKDWQLRNANLISNQVQSQAYPNSIVLLHDIHPSTVEALPSLLDYLQREEYVFVTTTELLGENLNPQLIYYDKATMSAPQS